MDSDPPAEGPPPAPPPPPPPPAPFPPPPVPAPPPPGAVGIRWGFGDFVWVFLSQVAGVVLAVLVWRLPGLSSLSDDEAGAYLLFPSQYAAMALALVLVARKGRRSLRADFGFAVRVRDWTSFLAGMGWQIVMIVVLSPFVFLLDSDEPAQETLRVVQESPSRGAVVVLGVGAVIVAPLVEELLFRGLLFRALLRRRAPWIAVALSGTIFGMVHVFGATGLVSVATIAGLSGFGMVLALQAYRSRSLSRPILTHMGFNFAGFIVTLLA